MVACSEWVVPEKAAVDDSLDPCGLGLGIEGAVALAAGGSDRYLEFAKMLVESPHGGFWLFGEEFRDYDGSFIADVEADGLPTADVRMPMYSGPMPCRALGVRTFAPHLGGV